MQTAQQALDTLRWTPQQADIIRWYWQERRHIAEIAEWLFVSPKFIERELYAIRVAVRAGIGADLPTMSNGGRKKAAA